MAIFGRKGRTEDTAGLTDRVRALGDAAEACEGRVPAEAVSEAQRVVRQVDKRLAFSGSATVVALAGATGSGKSSLFNALSGTDLARIGLTRPTTSEPLAVTWGDEPTEDLLDWLQVARRHALAAGSGSGPDQSSLDGLVLLDLPDHDSTEKGHQLQVDRMVQLVDVLVWVVDPQKYADAVLHERYLQPLAEHAVGDGRGAQPDRQAGAGGADGVSARSASAARFRGSGRRRRSAPPRPRPAKGCRSCASCSPGGSPTRWRPRAGWPPT